MIIYIIRFPVFLDEFETNLTSNQSTSVSNCFVAAELLTDNNSSITISSELYPKLHPKWVQYKSFGRYEVAQEFSFAFPSTTVNADTACFHEKFEISQENSCAAVNREEDMPVFLDADKSGSFSESSPKHRSLNVKQYSSEIMIDANLILKTCDKSPKLQDFYTTTNDLVSPELGKL